MLLESFCVSSLSKNIYSSLNEAQVRTALCYSLFSAAENFVLDALYLADACHRSDRVMRVLSGALQCSHERELLLQEEPVVLLDVSQSLLYLIHVSPLLGLGREGEKGSCFLEMMQFYVCNVISHLGWNCVSWWKTLNNKKRKKKEKKKRRSVVSELCSRRAPGSE